MQELSANWIGNSVPTLFYQGIFSSQVQLSKYVGERGFNATTGEKVTCKNAFDVIWNPFIGTEIDEIKPVKRGEWVNPIEYFQSCFFGMANKMNGIKVEGDTEYTISSHSIDIKKISIAQHDDVSQHKKKFDSIEDKSNGVILYGISKGAATTLNAICVNKYKDVKLVILEGCFTNVFEVFVRRYGETMGPYFYKALKMIFTNHKEHGISPKSSVYDFPKDLPIAFITSKKDKSVPSELTISLAETLSILGNPVYLLVLENSSHPNYMFDDKEDKEKYLFLFMHFTKSIVYHIFKNIQKKEKSF